MASDFISEQPAREASGPKPSKKLYSIPALLRDRAFAGKFETSTAACEFIYAPKSARLVNGKLELTGSLNLSSARGGKREVKDVRATLTASQGGLGAVPGAIMARALPNAVAGLPVTEATAAHGFVGVMYFRLSPINNKSLGVIPDFGKVQLNARMAPVNGTERELQIVYSDLVIAAYGERSDAGNAAAQVELLNRLLGQS